MNNTYPLTVCLRANARLIAKNAVITPFLPLKAFEQYAAIENTYFQNDVSAGFAKELTILRCGIGAQNIYSAIEALKNTNCRRVVFIGSCGGLGKARMGDILIADQKGVLGVQGLAGSFGEYLKIKGVPASLARIYSVESVKDETEALIDNLEKGGFLGVDLETAVFARTAAMNALESLAVLYATDLPLKRPFTARFTPAERDKISAARDMVVKNTLGFIETLP